MRLPRNIDEALRDRVLLVLHALKGLVDQQGQRARRNARSRLNRSLYGLKQAVNERFPAPARKPIKRTSYANLSPLQVEVLRKRKLRTQGYVEIDQYTVRACAVAGVKVRTVKNGGMISTWGPAWTQQVGPDEAKLRRCRLASPADRRAMLTELMLRRGGVDNAPTTS